MNNDNSRLPYIAPQTEIIVIQVESNFMVESTAYFAPDFDFGDDNYVGDGGDI